MTRLKCIVAVLLTVAISVPTISSQAAQQPKPIRIGMTKTLVPDQPKTFVDIGADEFKAVMKKTTGLDGDVNSKLGPTEIADKLNDKQLDFGLLYAHEFAWAQKKYPDLRPILVAATKKADKRAVVIVRKDDPAKSIADLKGKKLDLPLGTKEYCRIYLEKLCKDQKGPANFFGSIAKSATQIDALDEVARGKAHVTVIDTLWLDFYKEIKGPVFAKNLRVLQESGQVPPAVIVYKHGALPEATVNRVRDGLLKAHTEPRGRGLMVLYHIDSFELVPDTYAKSLAEVLKDYPPPAEMR